MVAKEISPVSVRCDNCVTGSFPFFSLHDHLVFLPPLLGAPQCLITATSHVSSNPAAATGRRGDMGGSLVCFSFSKITGKVTASHVMSGEKPSRPQENLALVNS